MQKIGSMNRRTQRRVAIVALLLVSLILVMTVLWNGRSRAENAIDGGAVRGGQLLVDPGDRWRIGFNVASYRGLITDYDVSDLRAGWYCDYTFQASPARPFGMEYVQMVRTGGHPFTPSAGWWASLQNAVVANPGSLWLIGNEPDCIDQDNTLPTEYAQRFHDIRQFIKDRDSTARIANGGIVQPTPLRLQWLDMVLQAYQSTYGVAMTEHVDVWNMHNQILHEERGGYGCGIPPGILDNHGADYTVQDSDNLEIFMDHVRTFRQWMKDHGQQDKPLIISEYGVLMPLEYGFTADRVNDFMTSSFTYLLYATDPGLGDPSDGNRMVQQWCWFSLNECPWNADPTHPGWGFNGALFDWESEYPGEMTSHGEHWVELMQMIPFPSPTPSTTPAPAVFRREVEDGTLYEPLVAEYDETSSRCYYVRTPPGEGGGSVAVSLYARESGSYVVWARVLAPDGAHNRFNVRVDDTPVFAWDLPAGQGWVWDRISEAGGADPVVFNVSKGWHYFRFATAENEACIDVLEFMTTSTTPDKYTQPCATPTPPGIEVPLTEGANLVSFPVIPPDTSVSEVLASVWDSMSKVYSYEASDPMNPWRVYDKNLPPGANTLTDLDNTIGFWLYVDTAGVLVVNGERPGATELQLFEGANLISYPCMDARDVTYVLAPISGKYTKVYCYDSSDPLNPWRVYDTSLPPGANTLTEFEPGRGYWLYVTENCTLTIMQ